MNRHTSLGNSARAESTTAHDPRDRTISRQRVVIVIAVVAAALSLLALAASLYVKSPQQRAAQTAPPAQGPITAAVRSGVLTGKTTVRGTVRAAEVQPVLAPPLDGQQIVTRAPARIGAKVAAGDVVAEVSGRPVMVLSGATPSYRTMRPGTTGKDVAQLQEALISLGHFMRGADPTGTYGPATARAVAGLYQEKESAPSLTSDADPSEASAIDSARVAVKEAERKVADDQRSYDGAKDVNARSGALRELARSQVDLADAEQSLSGLTSRSGVQVPFGEVVFVPRLPATVVAVSATVGASLADATSSELLALSPSALVVAAVVPEGSQIGLKAGLTVAITDDLGKRTAAGAVKVVGGFRPGSEPKDGSAPAPAGYPVTIAPTKPLPADWLGTSVRLDITVTSTTRAVLIVPIAAVTTSADGTASVDVVGGDERRSVRVKTGLVAGGEVEVRSISGGALNSGDQVVIG